MISSIIVALIADKIKSIYLPMFITGMVASYVDFLTVPIISLGLPLTVYFLIIQKQRRIKLKETIKIIVVASINWGMGYLLTWLSKWLLMDILYGRNLIATAIGQTLYRTTPFKNNGILDTVWKTARIIKENIIYIAVGSAVITIVRLVINRKRLKPIKERLEEILPYFIIMLMPFAWYLVLSGHSYQHAPFTYRALLLLLTSMSLIILKLSEGEKYDFKEKIKNNPILKKIKEKINVILKKDKKLLTGECEK